MHSGGMCGRWCAVSRRPLKRVIRSSGSPYGSATGTHPTGMHTCFRFSGVLLETHTVFSFIT